jgi:hypothetical protein
MMVEHVVGHVCVFCAVRGGVWWIRWKSEQEDQNLGVFALRARRLFDVHQI